MKIPFVGLFFLFNLPWLFGETLLVQENISGKSTQDRYVITRVLLGNQIQVTNQDRTGISQAVLGIDGQGISFRVNRTLGQIAFFRNGNTLSFKGTWQGNPKEGRVDLKGLPWFGNFDLSFKAFLKTGKRQWVVALVSSKDPDQVRELEMTLEGEEVEQGQKILRIKVNHAGLLSALWSAYYWVLPDGSFYRFRGTQGPGTPYQETQLLNREP